MCSALQSPLQSSRQGNARVSPRRGGAMFALYPKVVTERHRGLEPEGTGQVVSPGPAPSWRSEVEYLPKAAQLGGSKRTV